MFPVPIAKDLAIDTLGLQNSSPSSKRYLIIPLEEKKRKCRHAIYKWIDTSTYYGYMNDDEGILEKVEMPTKEEM
jgi:pre-mRNA-splicing factor ISY1